MKTQVLLFGVLTWLAELAVAEVLFVDLRLRRVVEMRGNFPICRVYTEEQDIRRLLQNTDPSRVQNTHPEEFDSLVEACHEAAGVGPGGSGGNPRKQGHRQTGFMYPGTKWCGPGNTATHYDDLGYHAEEDACCREHDHCPSILEAGQCSQGLCNNAIYTKSHCDCDARFRRCLQNLGTDTANFIGYIFFNVAQVTCFKEKRPCYPEDTDDQGRCRLRFHVVSRYEADGRSSSGPSLGSSLVSNLLSSFLPFRRK